MNELEKLFNEKRTENGDKAYKSTGNNLVDIFFMTPYFEKNLDEVTIGSSEKEKLFSMFVRDGRFGLGRRDLGRKLMRLSGVDSSNIIKAGRFDDLWHIPTQENIDFLYKEAKSGNDLAKKWLPRLTGKDKKVAKALCKMWKMTEKEYRAFIKTEKTTEYKLSYAEKEEGTPLNELFNKNEYKHPLVNEINFEQVPSLAMTKYLHTFSTREDLKERFSDYIKAVKEEKAKVNVKTTNVYDAMKTATRVNVNYSNVIEDEAREVVANKIVDKEMLDVEMDAIVILDTSGSMGGWHSWGGGLNIPNGSLLEKAMSIAYAISSKSTYAKNQIISFSSRPQLMNIKGNTLKEKYESMYTGDCSNTDFGKVMELLKGLKRYPQYLIVISDMEFDCGSCQSKEETMRLFKKIGAPTKIIWWNVNDRNKTTPEFDEYGNIYLSGYNMQILKLLENNFDMSSYIDKILEKYKKDIDYIETI